MAPRKLTSHIVEGAPNYVDVFAIDEPGFGGAHHHYLVMGVEDGPAHIGGTVGVDPFDVKFQNGGIAEVGVNGCSIESLVAIAIDRLECFQAGPFASTANEIALNHFKAGMDCLHQRTKDRIARGVEGQLKK